MGFSGSVNGENFEANLVDGQTSIGLHLDPETDINAKHLFNEDNGCDTFVLKIGDNVRGASVFIPPSEIDQTIEALKEAKEEREAKKAFE